MPEKPTFPLLAYLVLEVLGVMNAVTIYFEEIDARDGWISEIRIN